MIIKADGWEFKNASGSHYQYKYPLKSGIVTIPYHTGDIAKLMIKYVFQQAKIERGTL
jgi:predicted RNA binding protein YcfA (HicA-like mRNA interferase family)